MMTEWTEDDARHDGPMFDPADEHTLRGDPTVAPMPAPWAPLTTCEFRPGVMHYGVCMDDCEALP